MGFAERLLEVIDSGRRTATYKLALLITLLDLCARHNDARGRAPELLYTRDIAEQVAGLYWPQVIPYLVPGSGSAVELRQITLPRAAVIAAVSAFRRAADAAGAPSWHLARQRLPGPYESMLDVVEVTVAQQPLAAAAGGRVHRYRVPLHLRARLGTTGILLAGAVAPSRPSRGRHPAASRRGR